jgi:imidazolonepropionase-like amidohydrolase
MPFLTWLLAVFAMAAFPTETIPDLAAQASRAALAKGTFAITDVTVVPMTSDTLLPGSTVLVRDGRIATVGPNRTVELPADTRRIDGRGRYLIPGLADMHIHLYSVDEVPDSVAP